jgi:hypothetical protein
MSEDVIPVSVLTGFLGSGKTTMLRHLLGQPEFARTAVIINEFGEVGIDHDLIEASEDSFIELQTGCLCCKIRTDLAQTLQDLLRRRDEGPLRALRSHRHRDERTCRSGADPANADDRHEYRGPPRARRRRDDGGCRQRRGNA